MTTQNQQHAALRDRIEAVFTSAPFIQDMGIEFTGCGPGWCEAELELLGRHGQQAGFAHAGVQTTLADHTAGAAAMCDNERSAILARD